MRVLQEGQPLRWLNTHSVKITIKGCTMVRLYLLIPVLRNRKKNKQEKCIKKKSPTGSNWTKIALTGSKALKTQGAVGDSRDRETLHGWWPLIDIETSTTIKWNMASKWGNSLPRSPFCKARQFSTMLPADMLGGERSATCPGTSGQAIDSSVLGLIIS